MPVDLYAELIKCTHKKSLYYVERWEEEVLIYSVLSDIFPEHKKNIIMKYYLKIWDSCKSMDELRWIIIKDL